MAQSPAVLLADRDKRLRGEGWAKYGLLGILIVSLVCAIYCVHVPYSSESNEPEVLSMYHMWLGSNGLPVSPRKQRAKLFEFCTTHFVTEAEMRYCYARLLSVGNPSGPVKYAGQPQYDSEQVVAPLFTFAMPPTSAAAESSSAPAPAAAAALQPSQLAMRPVTISSASIAQGPQAEWAAFYHAVHHSSPSPTLHAIRSKQTSVHDSILRSEQDHSAWEAQRAVARAEVAREMRDRVLHLETEAKSLKAQIHAQAARKAPLAPRRLPTLALHIQAPVPAQVAAQVAATLAAPKVAAHASAASAVAPVFDAITPLFPTHPTFAKAPAALPARTATPAHAASPAAPHTDSLRRVAARHTALAHPAARSEAAGELDDGLAAHYFDQEAHEALAKAAAAAHAVQTQALAKFPPPAASHSATAAGELDLKPADHYWQQARATGDARLRAAGRWALPPL